MSCSLLTSPRKHVALRVPSSFSGSTANRSAVRATKLRGLCGTTLLGSLLIVVSYHKLLISPMAPVYTGSRPLVQQHIAARARIANPRLHIANEYSVRAWSFIADIAQRGDAHSSISAMVTSGCGFIRRWTISRALSSVTALLQ